MLPRQKIEEVDIVRTIPLTKLRPAKVQVRPDVGDVSDLVASFQNGRQLHNIVVRHVPDEDAYEIICGHRRVEAARQCGWEAIDAFIIEADDLSAEMYALEENLHRKSQPDEAVAIARLYAIYAEMFPAQHGGDRKSSEFKAEQSSPRREDLNPMATVAQTIGKSEETARRYVKVGSKGIPKLREAHERGEIRLADAARIAGLPADEQERAIDQLVIAQSQDPTDANTKLLLSIAEHLSKAAVLADQLRTSGGMLDPEIVQVMWEARERFNKAQECIWERSANQLSDEIEAERRTEQGHLGN